MGRYFGRIASFDHRFTSIKERRVEFSISRTTQHFTSIQLTQIVMTATIPAKQIGLISTKAGVKFAEFAVPEPGPDEVLIQNVAVASNPKDWKLPLMLEGYRGVEGNDVAGYIVKVGPGVTEYQGGERVAAFTKMVQFDERVSSNMFFGVDVAKCCLRSQERTCNIASHRPQRPSRSRIPRNSRMLPPFLWQS